MPSMSDVIPAAPPRPRRYQSFKCIQCHSTMKAEIKVQSYRAKCPRCKTPFSVSKAGTISFPSPSSPSPSKRKKNRLSSQDRDETDVISLASVIRDSSSFKKTIETRAIKSHSSREQARVYQEGKKCSHSSSSLRISTVDDPSHLKKKSKKVKKGRKRQKERRQKRKISSSSSSHSSAKLKARKTRTLSRKKKGAKASVKKSKKRLTSRRRLSQKPSTESELWAEMGKEFQKKMRKNDEKLARTSHRLQKIENEIIDGIENLEKTKNRRAKLHLAMIFLVFTPLAIGIFFLLSAVPNRGFTTKGELGKFLSDKGEALKSTFHSQP